MDEKKEEQLDYNNYCKQVVSTINNPNMGAEEKSQLLSALTNRFQDETEKKFGGPVFDKPKVKGPIRKK